jgi:hypothetical protein
MYEPPRRPLVELVPVRRAEELHRNLRSMVEDGTLLQGERSDWFAQLRPHVPTARSILGEAVPTVGSILKVATVRSLGPDGETMRSLLQHATTRSLSREEGGVAAEQATEADATRSLAAQFRAERPRRNPRKAEGIANLWKRQWGTSIEEDHLTVEVSVVPAQRLRDVVEFTTNFPELTELVAHFDTWTSTTAELGGTGETARPGQVASPVEQLRDAVHHMACLLQQGDLSAVEEIKRHGGRWWSEQRAHCADAAHAWCVVRRRRPRRGLWQTIAEVLWYHGWDVDPDGPKDVARLKMEWSRRRNRPTPAAPPPHGGSQ